MKITDFIKNNILILDGGFGTMLQEMGHTAGELPETVNLTNPDAVTKIHREYLEAGSNLICTNTFGANSLKFSLPELENIISQAVNNAREAVRTANNRGEKWIALDVGPTGRMLKPLGDLDFEEAVEIFAATVRLGVKYGVDLIFIETMSDSYETKAALLAAKENCDLPVFVSNAYGEDGKLMTGASPAAMVALLEGMGADAIGVNCSFGPNTLMPVISEYLKYSSVPVFFKPNAGLPSVVDGVTVYDLSPEEFADRLCDAASMGVGILGGCCGTTPKHISALKNALRGCSHKAVEKKSFTMASSYTHAVIFGDSPILIGERINPTGKPRFKEALRSGDIDYILREAIAEEEAGAHVLDVNVGLPEINESKLLPLVTERLQAVVSLPLQIDTADPVAMEAALRRYNGKAMINSVNGKADSMASVLPLVKKYGGLVVCLTLDEGGIPDSAEGRFAIARRIYDEALSYGISPRDLIFDPLAMTVSTNKNAARETLRAVKMIRRELGCHTSLGISNVSFGLPRRELINATFLGMALESGLGAAIINPLCPEIMDMYHSFLALSGLDGDFLGYISHVNEARHSEDGFACDLKTAIIKGLRDEAATLTRDLLKNESPIEIIKGYIAPALDTVGVEYEAKRIYLPSLLMSAEAASSAFEVIRAASTVGANNGIKIVIATVEGDIHDIGKNIVKLILENYGFAVTDLGKNVSPQKIADEVSRLDANILGLSALMTTTLPAMERTVRLVRERAPKCKIMVGGAVLSEEYARNIGADFYGRDAMEAVRYAERVKNVNKT